MLLGTYYHTLEATRRLSLPKQFRNSTETWIVTRGLDGCLFLIPQERFTEELQEIAQRSFTNKDTRDLTRLFANAAAEVSPDAHGRVQLPEYLTQFAALEKHVVLVGSLTRVELWDRDKYHNYMTALEPQAEALAERFNDTETRTRTTG